MKSPLEHLKRLMRNDRAWRIFLISAFAIPVLLVLPHARSLVVRNAVSTAYLSTVRAPISGFIQEISVEEGVLTREGQALIRIRNDQLDGSRVARLEVLEDRARQEVGELRAQLESLQALADTRNREYRSNISSAKLDLASQLRIATDRSRASEASLKEAQGNLNRVRRLYDDELLSISDVEAAEAAHEHAFAERSANELERVRLTERVDEAAQGVFQVEIPEGVLLTRQAAQDLDIELLHLRREVERSEANLQATIAETRAARLAYEKRAASDITLPAGKKIWRVHASAGTWTNEGNTLFTFVDCQRLMLDIAVDDATLELIEPGIEVRARLFGSFQYRTGEVILVRGSSALFSDLPNLAAEAANRGQRQGRVLARLNPSDLSDDPAKSCGIGRTAYVEFEDINLFEMLILPLFR